MTNQAQVPGLRLKSVELVSVKVNALSRPFHLRMLVTVSQCHSVTVSQCYSVTVTQSESGLSPAHVVGGAEGGRVPL